MATNYAVAPGEYLQEWIDEQSTPMTQADLAQKLGMSRKQISVIYLMCGIILICVTIILAWAILGIMGVICNDILVEQYIWYTDASTLSNLTILTFGWLPFVLIGVFGIAIAVISTLLPIWKIGRMKPIDAIRNE